MWQGWAIVSCCQLDREVFIFFCSTPLIVVAATQKCCPFSSMFDTTNWNLPVPHVCVRVRNVRECYLIIVSLAFHFGFYWESRRWIDLWLRASDLEPRGRWLADLKPDYGYYDQKVWAVGAFSIDRWPQTRQPMRGLSRYFFLFLGNGIHCCKLLMERLDKKRVNVFFFLCNRVCARTC